MDIKALNCPNCGGSINPAKYRCEYCGSYVIFSTDNYVDLSNESFDLKPQSGEKYPGIYVFGRLLGKGEMPIALGSANYYTGKTSAGGKLFLSNKSLSFSAHGFNVGRQESRIELNQIIDARFGKNLLISQQILVETMNEIHKFVVYHGKDWIKLISNAIRNYDNLDNSFDKIDISGQKGYSGLHSGDYVAELQNLKILLNQGIITEEEFNIKKRMLLGI